MSEQTPVPDGRPRPGSTGKSGVSGVAVPESLDPSAPPARTGSADLPDLPRARERGVGFRRMREADDLPFLFRLYASTREEELAPVPWTAEQKQAFLAQQFQAQHSHYMRYFPGSDWLIAEVSGTPVGRLYLDTRDGEIRIIDIALMPDQRRQGLGRAMLEDVLALAAAGGRSVSIHVEQFNPAMRLYLRLGFVTSGEAGVYHLMRWSPPRDPLSGREIDTDTQTGSPA